MCEHEIKGDYYRGCRHFHGRFYTGEISDCNSQRCKSSKSHMHKTALNCGCPTVVTEDRKIENLFQTSHPDCEEHRRK